MLTAAPSSRCPPRNGTGGRERRRCTSARPSPPVRHTESCSAAPSSTCVSWWRSDRTWPASRRSCTSTRTSWFIRSAKTRTGTSSTDTTSLVSDVVVFNSLFNMDSFLSSIPSFLKKIPDHRPTDLDHLIRPKCLVLSYPVHFPDVSRLLPKHKLLRRPAVPFHVDDITTAAPGEHQQISGDEVMRRSEEDPRQPTSGPADQNPHGEGDPADQNPGDPADQQRPLHIVWPHRWEHDKNPELFFNTLLKLKEKQLDFHLSVLGETFTDVPEIFSKVRCLLDSNILSWGYLSSKEEYLQVLCQADVVVSTANHEFFGVAMLEAVHCGCFPLCPKALVYPEIFPAQYLYSTPEQLCKRLQGLCRRPDVARRHVVAVDTASFSWASLKPHFQALLVNERP
ncbi:tRNA-queuosine alpha-mannosyltransferase isoform X3 [Embiotoca jacksoni]|uniref:tRNA-queuosine alpha-mannosyltransferase isoform X3 n=1 Tax=Embiotoca jacksoni TaxID=100190 RepID=UPI0037043D82